MNKSKCIGCVDNFYNGNNDLNIKECWLFSEAELVFKKKVPLNQRPPFKQKAIKVPNCYRQKGYVFMKDYSQGEE